MKQPPFHHMYQHDDDDDGEENVDAAAGASAAMEVDDGDPVDILADFDRQQPPLDVDFFNSFQDDFDDQDLA